jgi:restriction system protein
LSWIGWLPILAGQCLQEHTIAMIGLGLGLGLGLNSPAIHVPPTGTNKHPEFLLQTEILHVGDKTSEGHLIRASALPWLEIVDYIDRNPEFLFQFAQNPRKFEEFIAASYERAGFDEVILTPQRGDGGRDVIATKKGWGSVRFLEQTKAYSPGHLVTHDDVRAMLGTLATDQRASKALITTTSAFQPGILKSGSEFERFVPHRLELKDGVQTREWVRQIAAGKTAE